MKTSLNTIDTLSYDGLFIVFNTQNNVALKSRSTKPTIGSITLIVSDRTFAMALRVLTLDKGEPSTYQQLDLQITI